MEFPFTYGKIVTGSRFVNRKDELGKLKDNIEHGINTVLISPRRWGKSSLVKHVSKKLSKIRYNITIKRKQCYLDCQAFSFLEIALAEYESVTSVVFQRFIVVWLCNLNEERENDL